MCDSLLGANTPQRNSATERFMGWTAHMPHDRQLTVFSGVKMLTICIRLAILFLVYPKRTLYTFMFELVQPMGGPAD
jgi:hypothetical protein